MTSSSVLNYCKGAPCEHETHSSACLGHACRLLCVAAATDGNSGTNAYTATPTNTPRPRPTHTPTPTPFPTDTPFPTLPPTPTTTPVPPTPIVVEVPRVVVQERIVERVVTVTPTAAPTRRPPNTPTPRPTRSPTPRPQPPTATPTETPGENFGRWTADFTDNGFPIISTIATEIRPEGEFVALLFACNGDSLAGGVGWSLPFTEGRYNETFKAFFGSTGEGVDLERTFQWSVSQDGSELLTVFGNPHAVLLELLNWSVVGINVYDVQGEWLAGAYFEIEGLGDTIRAFRPDWNCA